MNRPSVQPPIPISKPLVGSAEKKAVLDVLDSGILVQGPRVAQLETEFSRLVGVEHAIATSSGTSALHLALLANGIGPGDEVITTPFTFIASVNSILYTGATPHFIDIDEDTFNMRPDLIEAAVGPNTRAILPVHLFGYPCDMEAIATIAKRHNLLIVEDCAQAVGSRLMGKHVGSFGTGAFSLYATKNVMCGEGGMVTTNDQAVAARVRLLRNHGMSDRYLYETLGFNLRMSEIHAAIGLAQLRKLKGFARRREINARYLTRHLRSIKTPLTQDGYDHAWHQYTVRLPRGSNRNSLIVKLSNAGIGTGVYYPEPVSNIEHVRRRSSPATVPIAELVAKDVLSVPVHPGVTQSALRRIVAALNEP